MELSPPQCSPRMAGNALSTFARHARCCAKQWLSRLSCPEVPASGSNLAMSVAWYCVFIMILSASSPAHIDTIKRHNNKSINRNPGQTQPPRWWGTPCISSCRRTPKTWKWKCRRSPLRHRFKRYCAAFARGTTGRQSARTRIRTSQSMRLKPRHPLHQV